MADGPPLFRTVELQRTSGGGKAVAATLALVAQRHPDVLGVDPLSTLAFVPRNWADRRLLRSRRFAIMPQNAWPWAGDVAGLRPRARRTGLRIASEVSMRRAMGTVRLGESIPAIGRPLGPVLGNVLDTGFEEALDRSAGAVGLAGATGSLICVGSLTSYRGLSTLFEAYRRYRLAGGSLPLLVAGPGELSRSLAKSVPPDVRVATGLLDRAMVIASFRVAAAAIFPSTVEVSSPLALEEARATCRVVIASDIVGHLQQGSSTSYFRTGDPSSLMRCLSVAERTWENSIVPDPTSSLRTAARREKRERWTDALAAQLRSCAERQRAQ